MGLVLIGYTYKGLWKQCFNVSLGFLEHQHRALGAHVTSVTEHGDTNSAPLAPA